MTWMLMMLSTALATGVTHEEVDCPYGEGKVRRYHKVSSNNLGGYDSDLARYSTRAQFREFAVSTCPSNYFSMLGKDLNLVVPTDKASAIDSASRHPVQHGQTETTLKSGNATTRRRVSLLRSDATSLPSPTSTCALHGRPETKPWASMSGD